MTRARHVVESNVSLYGKVVRVGGVEPRIHLATEHGRIVLRASQELVKELGSHLYENVRIRAWKRMDPDARQVIEYRAEAWRPWDQAGFEASFVADRDHWPMRFTQAADQAGRQDS